MSFKKMDLKIYANLEDDEDYFWCHDELDRFETELEAIESFAQENNLISSEEELSDAFDNNVSETWSYRHWHHAIDDELMIGEEFSYYADTLVKDGELTNEQYRLYDYVNDWELIEIME